MASTMVALTGLSKLRSLLATEEDQAGTETRMAGQLLVARFLCPVSQRDVDAAL